MEDVSRPNLSITTDLSQLDAPYENDVECPSEEDYCFSPTGDGAVQPMGEDGSPTGFLGRASQVLSVNLTPRSQQADKPTRQATWGTTIFKQRFQDMDLLESGYAREYLQEASLSPTQAKSWTYTTVERGSKTQYKMYWQGDEFLLSARQIGGDFYISQYEHFADCSETQDHMNDIPPESHYCAVLRKVNDHNYKLYNCGCEGCDMTLGTYSCDNVVDDAEISFSGANASNVGMGNGHDHSQLNEGVDRQLLADITQFTKQATVAGSEVRCFSIQIPAVMEDRRSRVVWCPRQSRNVTPTGGTPRGQPLSSGHSVFSPSHKGRRSVFSFDTETPANDRIRICSKLPVWCPEVHSLMLKFHGGRVREASAKNFMLMLDEETALKSETTDAAAQSQKILMQFGKFSRTKFALDFRYPLAPIQAFAIGLSSCAWNVKVPTD